MPESIDNTELAKKLKALYDARSSRTLELVSFRSILDPYVSIIVSEVVRDSIKYAPISNDRIPDGILIPAYFLHLDTAGDFPLQIHFRDGRVFPSKFMGVYEANGVRRGKLCRASAYEIFDLSGNANTVEYIHPYSPEILLDELLSDIDVPKLSFSGELQDVKFIHPMDEKGRAKVLLHIGLIEGGQFVEKD